MPKRLSSQAVVALQDALAVIYHFKKDLRRFLQTCGVSPALLGQLDWENYKRTIVSALFDTLLADQERHLPVLTKLCTEVAAFEDFSHLRRLEDGDRKSAEAERAVTALRELVDTHQAIREEEAASEARRAKLRAKQESTDAFRRRLEDLRRLFQSVAANDANPQQRGGDLERVMRDLFDLFDLDPRSSFRIVGEQIDGAFTLDGTDFLFEAKWEQEPVDRSELDAFAAKVARKLDNTLGLFLSMSGFQDSAVDKHSDRRATILLMEAPDLQAVLEGKIDFLELLRRKRRHAAETGRIFFPIYPELLRAGL